MERELDSLSRSRLERAREADLLQFGLEEVGNAAPVAGEDVALAAQEARLAFGDALSRAAEGAREALSSDDGGHDALSAAAEARNLMEAVRDHDQEAPTSPIASPRSPTRCPILPQTWPPTHLGWSPIPILLATVSERRALLSTLTRKYGDNIDAVLEWADAAQLRLTELLNSDDHIEELTQNRLGCAPTLADTAGQLSSERLPRPIRLGAEVTQNSRRWPCPTPRSPSR